MGQPARPGPAARPPEAFDKGYASASTPGSSGCSRACCAAGSWPRSSPRRPSWSPTATGTRVSSLDNPRAWVRKVALNQQGSFLRAYLRQQARERDSGPAVRGRHTIKLADDHAEVWQAVRTLPPSEAR